MGRGRGYLLATCLVVVVLTMGPFPPWALECAQCKTFLRAEARQLIVKGCDVKHVQCS